jgi:hypothetical protein
MSKRRIAALTPKIQHPIHPHFALAMAYDIIRHKAIVKVENAIPPLFFYPAVLIL